jgi:hypothetical protein
MRGRRATRAVVFGVVVASVLAWAVPANAGVGPPPVLMPAVATHGDETVIAWSTRSQIMVATGGADGTFTSPTPVVGAGADAGSPRLAVTPSGDEVLVWQTGVGVRSAFRAAGDSAWLVENVGVSDGLRASNPVLAVDSSGRAVVAWVASSPGTAPIVRVSNRPPGGSWSDPVTVASDPLSVSLATDREGDVAVAYASYDSPSGTVWATILRSGETTWDMPTPLAPASQRIGRPPVVVGGGARTFVVTWGILGSPGPLAAARVRLPGSWESSRTVSPGSTVASPMAGTWSSAIDDLGNALVVAQYPISGSVIANTAVRLAVTDDQWAPSTTLDAPKPAVEADSAAGVTLADDGSATVAFMRREAQAVTLHVASTNGLTGSWIGADSVAGTLPCLPGRCTNEWLVPPAVALAGSSVVVVAQSYPAGVVIAFTRTSPDALWQGPVTLQGFGSTRVYLRSAHVRKGYIRVYASCALPPCRGIVVLRTTGGSQRTLGRVPFAVAGSDATSAPMQLPRWARASLRHGKRVRTLLTFHTLEGNGTTDTAERAVLLHA